MQTVMSFIRMWGGTGATANARQALMERDEQAHHVERALGALAATSRPARAA